MTPTAAGEAIGRHPKTVWLYNTKRHPRPPSPFRRAPIDVTPTDLRVYLAWACINERFAAPWNATYRAKAAGVLVEHGPGVLVLADGRVGWSADMPTALAAARLASGMVSVLDLRTEPGR